MNSHSHFVVLACALAILPFPSIGQAAPEKPAQAEPNNRLTLTLEQAIIYALEKSPLISAAASRKEAALAARSQAGAMPNPEISIEAENIFGGGRYDRMDGAELTYGVSQLIEMPGKRSGRVSLADADASKAGYQYSGLQFDLIMDVKVAYAAAIATRERLQILEDEQALLSEVRDSVVAKVEAGKEPLIQKNKAEIELAASRIASEKARRDYITHIRKLSGLIGSEVETLDLVSASLPAIKAPEPMDHYQSLLVNAPDAKFLSAEVDRAQSNLSLEKSNAIPDPAFNVGVRDFREDGEKAFIAGVSFPFPVFNMNRAGIERAGHELNAARMDQRGAQISRESDLSATHASFVNAFSEVVALKEHILPGAEEAFGFARIGYEAGKFNYLEVLDAQRTLFEVRKQLNETTLVYFTQRALIERMTPENNQIALSKKEQ